jgi:hypothetical protein
MATVEKRGATKTTREVIEGPRVVTFNGQRLTVEDGEKVTLVHDWCLDYLYPALEDDLRWLKTKTVWEETGLGVSRPQTEPSLADYMPTAPLPRAKALAPLLSFEKFLSFEKAIFFVLGTAFGYLIFW